MGEPSLAKVVNQSWENMEESDLIDKLKGCADDLEIWGRDLKRGLGMKSTSVRENRWTFIRAKMQSKLIGSIL